MFLIESDHGCLYVYIGIEIIVRVPATLLPRDCIRVADRMEISELLDKLAIYLAKRLYIR